MIGGEGEGVNLIGIRFHSEVQSTLINLLHLHVCMHRQVHVEAASTELTYHDKKEPARIIISTGMEGFI